MSRALFQGRLFLSDRLLSLADRRHIPAAAPLGPCAGPAGPFWLCGALTSEREMEKAPGVQCCSYSLVYGNKSAGTALPCGSFLLVVEELCPWGEDAWTEACLTGQWRTGSSGKCLCEVAVPSLLGYSMRSPTVLASSLTC